MKPLTKFDIEKGKAYKHICDTFPNYLNYPLKKIMYPLLSAWYLQFNNNEEFLHRLQHQSWLASFYEEFNRPQKIN